MMHGRFALFGVLLATTLVVALAACPPAKGGGTAGGTGGASVDPDACGVINTSEIGRKVYGFLRAAAELDRASTELERAVHDACVRMATELGVSPEGSTKDVCVRAANELDANLQISVKSEKRLVTRYAPPVCHTDVDFTAGVVAECEASTASTANVTCDGHCSGECNGACKGTCASRGTDNVCTGSCDGTCDGRCSGQCDGYAYVHASAECQASAEVRTSVRTQCSDPKVEVVQQDVTVVDDSKFKKAMAAINAGLPRLLATAKRLEFAGRALGSWVKTGASLVAATADLAGQLGDKTACVGFQLASVVGATATIQARFSVSIEVTERVTASAGATAQ